jgi:hypothetical protein
VRGKERKTVEEKIVYKMKPVTSINESTENSYRITV